MVMADMKEQASERVVGSNLTTVKNAVLDGCHTKGYKWMVGMGRKSLGGAMVTMVTMLTMLTLVTFDI